MSIIPNPAYIREREETAKQDGEVRTYFDPTAFEWFGCNALPRSKKEYVRFDGKTVYISAKACRMAGFSPGERVVFGLNKKYFAIRRAGENENGFLLTLSGKKSCALAFSGTGIKKIADILGNVEVTCDGNMLVGRRPENSECS